MTRNVGFSADEVRARLVLLAAPGLSAPAVLELLRTHGSGRAALAALTRPGTSSPSRNPEVIARVDRTLRGVAEEGIGLVWFDDERYPERLRLRLDDYAPPLLFARGDVALLDTTSIAVVGCRAASNYGLDVAAELGAAIGQAGGCVVSGVARGIDAAAQEAVLEVGGTSIGVLGCGIDVFYPRENTRLQERLAVSGLLLSEFFPGAPPLKHHFPYRNRIIAALSCAVVIVEGTEKSGAVKTAEHALQQGVAVYAVPNALDQPNFQGNRALIRDGAHVYTGARDLLETLGLIGVGEALPHTTDSAARPPDALHGRIWDRLSTSGRHVDDVAADAGLQTTSALVALLEMELDGRVRQLPGNRFARAPQRRRTLATSSALSDTAGTHTPA
jgi:DNA processing protein